MRFANYLVTDGVVMSRAAMQMALDALVDNTDMMTVESLQVHRGAIAALRAALAASDKPADVQTIVDTAAPLPPIDTHPDAQHRYTEAQMRLYWCDGAGYAMARMQAREAPIPLGDAPAVLPTDAQIVAAARALNKLSADACNVDEVDSWALYGNSYLSDACVILKAAMVASQ